MLFRHPVIKRQDSFSATSTFFTWVDLHHTGLAYSLMEKHSPNVDTLRVWPFASQFDPIHFLSKMFLELIFDFTFSQCFLFVRDLSRVTAKYLGNGICSISTPFHVIFNFWLANLLCRWKAQGTKVDRFLVVYPGQRLKRLKIYHRVRRKPEANAKGAQQNLCNPNQPTSLGTWYMIL